MPHPRVGGRLARALADAVPGSLRSTTVLTVSLGALLISTALVVPFAGGWLALALAVLAAWRYEVSVRESGLRAWGPPPPPRPGTNPVVVAAMAGPTASTTEPDDKPGLLGWLGRLSIGVLAVAALIAPVLIRNGGRALPETGDPFPYPGARIWMLVALVGWMVVPLVLLAAFAHDRRGRLSPRTALAGLARHPAATLAALMIPPLGLLVMECLLAFVSWQQGTLPLLVSDLYPPPQLVIGGERARLVYRYDDEVLDRQFSRLSEDGAPAYRMGFRRGFTLVGTIPASLTFGTKARMSPEMFRTSDVVYLGVRYFLSVLILTGMGLLLTLQSRWLGTIASLGSRRPPAVGSSSSPSSSSGSGLHPVAIPAPAPSTTPSPSPSASASVSPPLTAPLSFATPSPHLGPPAATFTKAGPGSSAHAPVVTPVAPPSPAPAAVPSNFGYPSIASPSPNGGVGQGVPPSARPLILIIEDELAVADAVARILLSKGYGVMIAGDGEEGLRQARAARPDLIVLDLLLPTMLGMDVCRTLRASEPTRQVPIIMATAVDTEADEIAGLSVGADDYLAKPYSIEVLVARIQKLLQRRVV